MKLPLTLRFRLWLVVKLMQAANRALGKKLVIVHTPPPSLTNDQYRMLNAEQMDHVTLQ
jgi:hypothetical protein